MSRKIYLDSSHFAEDGGVWTYTPTQRAKNDFENVTRLTVDNISLTLTEEPSLGVILVESEELGRKSRNKPPLVGQAHRNILCCVFPERRYINVTATTNGDIQSLFDAGKIHWLLDTNEPHTVLRESDGLPATSGDTVTANSSKTQKT